MYGEISEASSQLWRKEAGYQEKCRVNEMVATALARAAFPR